MAHVRFTIAINTKAREQLICEYGLFDKVGTSRPPLCRAPLLQTATPRPAFLSGDRHLGTRVAVAAWEGWEAGGAQSEGSPGLWPVSGPFPIREPSPPECTACFSALLGLAWPGLCHPVASSCFSPILWLVAVDPTSRPAPPSPALLPSRSTVSHPSLPSDGPNPCPSLTFSQAAPGPFRPPVALPSLDSPSSPPFSPTSR